MTGINLQKVRESSLELSSVYVLMVNTNNFSYLPCSNCLAHLNDPSDCSHPKEIILQLAVKQEHVVSGDSTEENLDPHLVVIQLREGEGLRVDAVTLDCESSRF